MSVRPALTRVATACFVLSLLATSCAGSDEENAKGDPPAATGAPSGELGRGVTEDTITIGYTYLDFDALVDQGLAASGYGDQELTFQTMVDALNEDGGINGRKVEVVYEPYSPLGTEDAEAACLRLTEDNEVFAVLGGFLGPAEPANSCIIGQQETVLVGGVQSAERLAEAKASWITDRATRERQADILFNLLDSEGKLDDAKVALVTNSDALETHDAVVDALGEYDLEPVEDLTLDAPIGDFPAEDAGWAPLAERVRSSGATAVLIAGNPSSTIRNRAAFGPDVDIWVLDQETLLNLGTSVSAEDARGVLAAAPPSNQLDLDSFADCRDTFTAANPDVKLLSPQEREATDDNVLAGLGLACNFLDLFKTVATAAGEDLNNETFAAALEGLDDFSIATQPYASFGVDKFDSNDSFQLVAFDPDLGPTGGLDPLTDVQDVTP